MHIEFVEIANFRKLLSIRIDLGATKTLFVGANNSGKTSAMLALRRFLSPRRCPFEVHDFTLCHWPTIDSIGRSWAEARDKEEVIDLVVDPWVSVLPTLDLWLNVESGEMHHVRDLIPTLDWEGGRLGVRLRYEPKDLKLLYKDFMGALSDAEAMRAAAIAAVGRDAAVTARQEVVADNKQGGHDKEAGQDAFFARHDRRLALKRGVRRVLGDRFKIKHDRQKDFNFNRFRYFFRAGGAFDDGHLCPPSL